MGELCPMESLRHQQHDGRDVDEAIEQAGYLRSRGETVAAQQLLQSCLERYPNNIALMRELAELYMSEGETENVVPLRLRILELAPDDPDAIHEAFIVCQLWDEEYDELVERLARHGLEIDPDNVNLLRDLASLAGFRGTGVSKEEALDLYERALRLAPNNWNLLLNFAGFLYDNFGRLEEALMVARRSLSEMPRDVTGIAREAAEILVKKIEQELTQT